MGSSQQILSSIGVSASKQILFESVGGAEVSWTVPSDVTSICAVTIGAGEGSVSGNGTSGGTGGDLVYSNGITVTPGETLTIRAGDSVSGSGTTQSSYIKRGASILVCAKGGDVSDIESQINAGTGAIGTGGLKSSGSSGSQLGGGGGGAGGYGGAGGSSSSFPSSGSNGGGGGGFRSNIFGERGGEGGGVGPYGQGASGGPGEETNGWYGRSGSVVAGKKVYGGGASGAASSAPAADDGQDGCVRIIWGSGRAFPSTRTLDE